MNQQVTQIKVGDVIEHEGKSLRFKGKLKAAYPWSTGLKLMQFKDAVDDCMTHFLRKEVIKQMEGKDGYEMFNMYADGFPQGIYCEVDIFEHV